MKEWKKIKNGEKEKLLLKSWAELKHKLYQKEKHKKNEKHERTLLFQVLYAG